MMLNNHRRLDGRPLLARRPDGAPLFAKQNVCAISKLSRCDTFYRRYQSHSVVVIVSAVRRPHNPTIPHLNSVSYLCRAKKKVGSASRRGARSRMTQGGEAEAQKRRLVQLHVGG